MSSREDLANQAMGMRTNDPFLQMARQKTGAVGPGSIEPGPMLPETATSGGFIGPLLGSAGTMGSMPAGMISRARDIAATKDPDQVNQARTTIRKRQRGGSPATEMMPGAGQMGQSPTGLNNAFQSLSKSFKDTGTRYLPTKGAPIRMF